uniref:Ubiquitin-like domain-containing protein n=1 Tax=Caenorhabditis japonica TaxID=281687 RepID=A0A8R1HN60_CAEJA
MPEQQQEQELAESSAAPSNGAGNQHIEVRVKALDDRETTINISSEETISSLVDRGRSQLGITSGFQRIIYQGRVLEPGTRISAAGIQNGHTVHLVNRLPGRRNDVPNVERRNVQVHPIWFHQDQLNNRPRRAFNVIADRDELMASQPASTLHPIRVPSSVNQIPVLASRYNEELIAAEARPLRNRAGPAGTQPPPLREISGGNPLNYDPHTINWRVSIIDNHLFPRDRIVDIARNAINNLPFLNSTTKAQVVCRWNENNSEFLIELPQMVPNIPSPALEKLDFMCSWTEFLKRIVEKMEEENGLVSMVREVLDLTNRRQTADSLPMPEREQRLSELDQIVKQFEIYSADLSHMKDYERQRFRNNTHPEYHRLKIQEHAESNNNPRFLMRHALDTDLSEAMRSFRAVRSKIDILETIMDDLTDIGALKFTRDQQTRNRDWRYQALSVFFHYMQRVRHQMAHVTHLTSELSVSFLTPTQPQRLLPQYALNTLLVPVGHPATLILKFRPSRIPNSRSCVPVTHIVEPPRRFSDVGDRNGHWPYLPFNPPGVSMDSVLAGPRRVADARNARPNPVQRTESFEEFFSTVRSAETANITLGTDSPPPPIEELLRLQDIIRRRRIVTTGDAPSVPVETQPPPVDQIPTVRRTTRFNVDPNARGPETRTLAALPVQIEPNELQRIAKNVASRYRADALQRIAANLTEVFRQESWDTRMENMPLCTLREGLSIALELLTSSGNTIAESKDLMLALVRSEDVLVRAIAECIKSLFGRGEFPTHVARLIMPRIEAASARNDYEDVDAEGGAQSDDVEHMPVRMPSDITQPQSGDLRAIRNARLNRFARMQAAASSSSTPTFTPTLFGGGPFLSPVSFTNPPGPSFSPEDTAEIRAGRLPGTFRAPRRVAPREANNVNLPPSNMFDTASERSGSPTQVTVTFTAHAHFLPMPPQMTSSAPGPSNSSRNQNAPGTSQDEPVDVRASGDSPVNPETLPSRSSAIRAQLSEAAASLEAVRAARERIDQLAANYNGSLDHRVPSPSNPTRRPNVNNRPMVAVDPFLACGHRQCEINRLQNPDTLPDSDRLTLQSLQPDPELDMHIVIQNLRPVGQRRPQLTSVLDPDYNYELVRTESGELDFESIDTFNKFICTVIRSLLSHCIDTDSLITQNMNPISGYGAANHAELINTVRRDINNPPYSRYNHVAPTLTSWPHLEEEARRAAEQENRRVDLGTYRPDQQFNRSPVFGETSSEDYSLNTGLIENFVSGLADYVSNYENPRAPGFFGLLMDLVYNRLSRHEFVLLTRPEMVHVVLGQHVDEFRDHLRRFVLEGRRNLPNNELHRMAIEISNSESFYGRLLESGGSIPLVFQVPGLGNDLISVSWMFRQIEITAVKGIITLAQYNMSRDAAAVYLKELIDAFLARLRYTFLLMTNGEPSLQLLFCRQISNYIASIRFEGHGQPRELAEFVNLWNLILLRWFQTYDLSEIDEQVFIDYIRATRAGNEWNDVKVFFPRAAPPHSLTTDSAASTASASTSTSISPAEASSSSSSEPYPDPGSVAISNSSPLRLFWTQLRRMFQENAIAAAVSRAMTAWMWWR